MASVVAKNARWSVRFSALLGLTGKLGCIGVRCTMFTRGYSFLIGNNIIEKMIESSATRKMPDLYVNMVSQFRKNYGRVIRTCSYLYKRT